MDETLHEHFTDLLYEVALREHGAMFIGVLFEHKSYLDKLTALQVLRYMVRVWDYGLRQQAQLLPILPIVIYHGPETWTVTTHFQGLFELPAALRPYMPEYQYWLCDLSAYSDAEVKGSVTLQVGWLLMKHIFTPALRERLPEVLALWYTIHEQPHAMGYLEAMLRYVMAAGETVSAAEVRQALAQTAPEGGALMNTIAQELLSQGEHRGLQQGLRQGLQQGEVRGERRGLRQGLLSGIRVALKLKFGLEGVALIPEIAQIEDVTLLQVIQDGIELVSTLPELRGLYCQFER